MYTFFTDRAEIFEAKIKLKNASVAESFCRLVLETDKWNLIFPGKLLGNQVTIPVAKLREVMTENQVGTVKLEVIAEDTYFTPWTDDFKVEASRTVQVEVVSQNDSGKQLRETPTVSVIVETVNADIKKNSARMFLAELKKHNITVRSINSNKKILPALAKTFINENELSPTDVKFLMRKLPVIVSKLLID